MFALLAVSLKSHSSTERISATRLVTVSRLSTGSGLVFRVAGILSSATRLDSNYTDGDTSNIEWLVRQINIDLDSHFIALSFGAPKTEVLPVGKSRLVKIPSVHAIAECPCAQRAHRATTMAILRKAAGI